jgi:ribosomal subunit interface protein
MQIEIVARHFSIGEDQREKIEGRLEKMARFSPRPPVSTRLKLTREGQEFAADLTFYLKSQEFRARAEGDEPELATEGACENLEKQLRRFKGRISGRQQGEEGGLGRALQDAGELAGAILEPEGFRLQDLSVSDAIEAFQGTDHPFLVFRNAETSRLNVIYHRTDGEVGLLESRDD